MTINSRSAKLSSPNVKVQDVPNVPTVGTPTQVASTVVVPFTPATTGGNAAIYRAISSPSGADAISYGSSPITISSGLTSGTAYTFAIRGETSTGATTGYSSASSSLTPIFSDMELISTFYGGPSVTGIVFNNIPQGYKHLQIRATARGTNAASESLHAVTVNGGGQATSWHNMWGNGSSVQSYAISGQTTWANNMYVPAGNAIANTFAGGIMDFLDYTSTSKHKTVRVFTGYASSTSRIELRSILFQTLPAITSISISGWDSTSFPTGSRFSLYGIKG